MAPERLRFDFSHYAPVSPRELASPREPRERARSCGTRRCARPGHGPRGGARLRARSPSSATSTASESAWSRSRASPRSSAAAPTSARRARSASSCSRTSRASPRARAASRRSPARRRSSGRRPTRASWRSSSRRRRSTAASLVDEYAKLREQLKAREREIQALQLKLATAAPERPRARTSSRSAGAQLWTPRFEGLDRKAHAAVVDDFRNRNSDQRVRARLDVD